MKTILCLMFTSLLYLKTSGQISQLEYIINTEYILNHKIKSVKIVGDSSLIIQDYGKNGQLINETSEKINNGYYNQSSSKYSYDKYGIVLENYSIIGKKWNNVNDSDKYSKNETIKYSRDGQGNLLYKIKYLENNEPDTLAGYTNDSEGKVVKEVFFDRNMSSSDSLSNNLFFYLDNKLIQKNYSYLKEVKKITTYSYKADKISSKRLFEYNPEFNGYVIIEFKFNYLVNKISHIIEKKDNNLNVFNFNYFELPLKKTIDIKRLKPIQKLKFYHNENPNFLDKPYIEKKYSVKDDLLNILSYENTQYYVSYLFY